ncbi:Predicted splicing regulator, contains RRM, SWAP and RPR domains [Ceraceosorus bombacis]|uniref:Predicted splicing regulator, contains RRM, SWAP and RPR domains n=1 Tax=Ceraceosorus bombacis TaxID=401625 RepID=A0A0P1BMG3_9BASI|nr:Predicted splicing regulator, contains RRM, SWAP and RPR domains [Ceraceosorus bombacis]
MELAYKEFLDDMDTESTKRKTGTFGSAKEEEEDKAKRKVPLGFVKAGGAGSGSATPSKSVVLPAGRVGAFGTEEEEDSPASNKRKDPPGKRKRLMDSFAGELASRWGDVGTAKIMYPREREANRQGLVGFVSYMKRSDAEYALREADGILWTGAGSFSGGPILRTGWGKAMPLPPTASFLQPSSAKIATSTARGASPTSTTVRARQRSPGSGPVPHRKPRPTASGSMPDLIKQVEEAVGASGMELIRDVAKRVVNHGDGYYLKAMRDNGTTDVKDKFAFMWDENLPAYHYYRTLVDPDHLPIIDAPPFADDGYLSLYSSDSEEGSEVERQRKLQKTDTLGPIARRRLEAMLRSITSRRERIARVMCFALERGAAADQISEVLVASLLQPGTPLARKLARLHAISDILHNSAVPLPNAWKYRAALEARLDAAFVHLGQTARVLGGRIRQEGFKEQVRSVLMLWEEWLVFTPDVCKRFRVKLDGNEEAHKEEHTAAMERTPDEDMRQGSSEGGSTRIRPAAHPGHVPLLG